jgi:NAD(P)-dependent dehydrogenase (short-subunit alcohol dehydrogenase family)
VDTPNLSGQVAIVTGGGRGLGQGMAQSLAAAGAAVAVIARSQGEIDETAALITRSGGKALAICADVTDATRVEQMVCQVEQEFGAVNLLVNNAGTVNTPGPIWEVDVEEWRRVVDVNLHGPFLCVRAVLPGMMERKQGRIINVSSVAGSISAPYLDSYSAAKTALVRFSECIAAETQAYGISIFTIDPGLVLTAMLGYLAESEAGHIYAPWARDAVQSGQHQSAHLSADLVLLLASGKADAFSGRFLSVNDPVGDLLEKAAQISQSDLYTLRVGKLST